MPVYDPVVSKYRQPDCKVCQSKQQMLNAAMSLQKQTGMFDTFLDINIHYFDGYVCKECNHLFRVEGCVLYSLWEAETIMTHRTTCTEYDRHPWQFKEIQKIGYNTR